MSLEEEALKYHEKPVPGKVEVVSSKPCNTDKALALAYSPGVAQPCIQIAQDNSKVYDYTTKGNLVAVISNGTAVLGLGNIGPLASKPVMEGKGILFKQFANINVFDIELKTEGVDEFITAVKALEPTFGGINLEDIKAPECFEIEARLKEETNIPVFHDDQHGTAIISAAALINACHIIEKDLGEIKMVINGAGAAAVACGRLFISVGVKKENITMCDSKGVIYKGRTNGMNKFKEEFAVDTPDRSLADAVKDSDCFIGLSVAGAMTTDMLKSMKEKPIVFAMANPDPEINPNDAFEVRDDVIMATGRSDFPNQVNNVLGFPYIFRGALDVRATGINEEMKLAAVHALADLAREDVPDTVSQAYGGKAFHFGPDYIIPKPFDQRVLFWVAPAVAKAAIESGVAQKPITDWEAYKARLIAMQGAKRGFVRVAINRIKRQANNRRENLPRIALPEASNPALLKALQMAVEEEIFEPILLGRPPEIKESIEKLDLPDLKKLQVYKPSEHPKFGEYAERFHMERHRKGVTLDEARKTMNDPLYYASMMAHMGDVDGLVTGSTQNYADAVRPILKTVGAGRKGIASGLNIVLIRDKVLFFADTSVNIDPTAEQLANIAIHASKAAKYFFLEPRVAMLSYSNFTGKSGSPAKMKEAAELVRQMAPHIQVDGDMQADTAVNPDIVQRIFQFCQIKDGANILIFPNLDSGNIAYKLVQQLGGGEVLGPLLMGVNCPANVVQRTGSIDDIFNTMVLTALQVQAYKEFELQNVYGTN